LHSKELHTKNCTNSTNYQQILEWLDKITKEEK
jgi:hypothetical protein